MQILSEDQVLSPDMAGAVDEELGESVRQDDMVLEDMGPTAAEILEARLHAHARRAKVATKAANIDIETLAEGADLLEGNPGIESQFVGMPMLYRRALINYLIKRRQFLLVQYFAYDMVSKVETSFAYLVLAKVHHQTKNKRECVKCARRAVELFTKSAEPFVFLGRRLLPDGDSGARQALIYAEQAIDVDPKDATAFDLKARALALLGAQEDAVLMAREAVRLEPSDPILMASYVQFLSERYGLEVPELTDKVSALSAVEIDAVAVG